MPTKIEILIKRIGAKLYEHNLTEREASIDATGKPDAIRYIRTRRSMPSADRLEKLATTLHTTPDWLLGRDDVPDRPAATETTLPDFHRLPKDLPVYGTALGADLEFLTVDGATVEIEQTELRMGDATDHMARPVRVAGRDDLYVVTVAGNSMVPRHDPGRRLLVEKKTRPMIGDDVVVQLARPTEDGEREFTAVLVKTLVKRRADTVVLRQYNPEVDFEVPSNRIAELHRVMPWDEALGI